MLGLACTYYLTEQERPLVSSKNLDWKLGTCSCACLYFFQCSKKRDMFREVLLQNKELRGCKSHGKLKETWKSWQLIPFMAYSIFHPGKVPHALRAIILSISERQLFWGKNAASVFCVSGPVNRLVSDTESPGIWRREGKPGYYVPEWSSFPYAFKNFVQGFCSLSWRSAWFDLFGWWPE